MIGTYVFIDRYTYGMRSTSLDELKKNYYISAMKTVNKIPILYLLQCTYTLYEFSSRNIFNRRLIVEIYSKLHKFHKMKQFLLYLYISIDF